MLRLCRRNILWLVGALMLVILFHLYFIKGVKTITTKENDHFPPLPKEFLSPSHTKFPSKEYCSRRIEEDLSLISNGTRPAPKSVQEISDYNILKTFSQLNCGQISALFSPPSEPSDEERNFPLAYTLQLYKGASLFVKQLQFIYMPQNVYCINIDTTSSLVFVRAIQKIARCLPNVFVTKKRIKVIYLHVSTVRAQLNCIEDLLQSSVRWRYLFNLCGQDFPLYSNQGLVQALKALNGRTNAESCKPNNYTNLRTLNVFEVKLVRGKEGHDAYEWANTGKVKTPPPQGIQIYKGSSFIAGTRKFCEYAVYDETAKAFLNWLNDTIFVDESFFTTLFRHPGVPGGVPWPEQQEFITRGAVNWYYPENRTPCHGYWLRGLCVLSLADLSWVFGSELKNMLFTQKIDFNYDQELVDCWYVMAQNRKTHPYTTKGISWSKHKCS